MKDYEKMYKEAIARANEVLNGDDENFNVIAAVNHIFPDLPAGKNAAMLRELMIYFMQWEVLDEYANKVKDWITELMKNQKHDDPILRDGVYIVYKDGRYALFDDHISDTEGILGVGICWHGHTWRIGTDFGDTPWSKVTDKELDAISYGIVEEWEALFDWDYMRARYELGSLWKHLPLADDESLPTAPMVLVQEYLAKHGRLNDALRFCGIPEYETRANRWVSQRYSASYARTFHGTSGLLNYNRVNNSTRSQAVALWSPNK